MLSCGSVTKKAGAQMPKHRAAPGKASKYAVGWARQYRVNLQRCFIAQIRNPTDACMRLLISTWVGLFAGAALDLIAALDPGTLEEDMDNLILFARVCFVMPRMLSLLCISTSKAAIAGRKLFLAAIPTSCCSASDNLSTTREQSSKTFLSMLTHDAANTSSNAPHDGRVQPQSVSGEDR